MSDSAGFILRALASLRLTVVLLALSMWLVFAGTWAQIDMGIWAVLNTYFHTFYVAIPFQIFFPREWGVRGVMPFPGGYVLGMALLVNLTAAMILRPGSGARRVGTFLIHVGLVILLVGELVTGVFAVEGNMTIGEGKTVNYAQNSRQVELAVIDRSDAERDKVVAIPQSRLSEGDVVRHPELPFDVRVERFMANSELGRAERADQVRANRGLAAKFGYVAEEQPQVSGVESNRVDVPTALVTLLPDDAPPLGTWLVSVYLDEELQPVTVNGRTYHIVMRFHRMYKPYSIHLIDFSHDRYLGTDTPMNYSSKVRLVDHERNEDREVLIYMNHPLRHAGETLYQSGFQRGDTGTILQVVRNPAWLLPYVACTIATLGMLIRFSVQLIAFLNRTP